MTRGLTSIIKSSAGASRPALDSHKHARPSLLEILFWSPKTHALFLHACDPPVCGQQRNLDQFPEGSGRGGGGGGVGGAGGGERYQPLGYQGRKAKRSLTPSMNYNQVSAGWSDFAEAIDSQVPTNASSFQAPTTG